ncbi:MAG: hypothetical protein QOE65_746 [Solirubrobacteraceae bacterium]|jgi:hypothetical protein|nr:hypothetical protein [Solirubrobacteraceae bacterium]
MRTALVLCGLGVAAAAGGCGIADDRDQARASASQFFAALQHGDGATACDHLSPATASNLEQQEKSSCPKAILGQSLGGGSVQRVRVYQTDAVVTLSDGEQAYLDRRAGGWKVSAAGCKPQGDAPADCEVAD